MRLTPCTVAAGLLLTTPAAALAQDSIFDQIVGHVVDEVNESVIREEIDSQTRDLQISATKMLLRGSAEDWDEFIDTSAELAGLTRPTGAVSASTGFGDERTCGALP